jgi:hypothetical protein
MLRYILAFFDLICVAMIFIARKMVPTLWARTEETHVVHSQTSHTSSFLKPIQIALTPAVFEKPFVDNAACKEQLKQSRFSENFLLCGT